LKIVQPIRPDNPSGQSTSPSRDSLLVAVPFDLTKQEAQSLAQAGAKLKQEIAAWRLGRGRLATATR